MKNVNASSGPRSSASTLLNPENPELVSPIFSASNLNDVQDVSVGYRCILDHTSSGANQPPNATFWEVLANPIPNTVKLVAKKIVRGIDKRQGSGAGFIRTLTGARKPLTGEV